MKILSAEQIRQWDAYTIAHEPIASIDLMERAASACTQWLMNNFKNYTFKIFCGKGNNGGDGLAIARMLLQQQQKVTVYILEFGFKGTADFLHNLQQLHSVTTDIHFIQSPEYLPVIQPSDIVIDAILGTGLNKALTGFTSDLVQYINRSAATVIAIDIPTGLLADKSCPDDITIKANYTLSFQQYKLSFFFPENESRLGQIEILDIKLDKNFYTQVQTKFELIDKEMASLLIKTRKKFSHKGHYGHAALLTGSLGMMGAATLCASACLRSGAGKLTCYLPQCGYAIMQITLPEATCTINGLDFLENWDPIVEHEAIGIGPGIGMHEKTVLVLKKLLLSVKKPMVFDADALNILASSPELMQQLPAHSILTPHPKEFERLFGKVEHDEERLELALAKAQLYNIYIVLKGHNSFIACPDGKGYFNETGNPGMATGGSGDVLTGILVGLLAQGYSSLETCILGVYVHGLAGDIAAAKLSMEAMLASDLTNNLGEAFLFIHHHRSTRRIV